MGGYMKIFSDRLKEIRKNSGMAQKEVAAELEMSLSGYQNLEYNQRDPKPETIRKLATLFNVSSDYLLGLENIQNRLLEQAFDVVLAQNEVSTTGMMYEIMKNREGESSTSTLQAYDNHLSAQGYYRRVFVSYAVEFFKSPNANPYEDMALKKKYPFTFSCQNDLFGGCFVNMKLADGYVIERVAYYSGGFMQDSEESRQKALSYIDEHERHYKLK
jgi:transcriptional regulator with XRE-family HTH domain